MKYDSHHDSDKLKTDKISRSDKRELARVNRLLHKAGKHIIKAMHYKNQALVHIKSDNLKVLGINDIKNDLNKTLEDIKSTEIKLHEWINN